MKAVCEMYPEFQEIAQPVFSYASSDSVQKILKDGVLSLETAKLSNAKMMEFMAIMVRNEPRQEKTCLPGFWSGLTLARLYSHRRWLDM